MTINDTRRWIDKESKKFLKDIGIENNKSILDFGCGVGNYTIPVAVMVGERGKVYAVDKNKQSLDELMQKAEKIGLDNIKRIDVSEEIKVPLQDDSVDVALLYDVIHLVDNRNELLAEIHRVSKSNALISVYPKHHRELMSMELDDVKNEIEDAGFSFERELYRILIHNGYLEKGYILNFRKR